MAILMKEDELLDMLTEVYRDSQLYLCCKCNHEERYPYHEIDCQECRGKMIHIGETGKSVEGSFQWYVARAKGEKV